MSYRELLQLADVVAMTSICIEIQDPRVLTFKHVMLHAAVSYLSRVGLVPMSWCSGRCSGSALCGCLFGLKHRIKIIYSIVHCVYSPG